MNRLLNNIPNKIKQPSQCCLHCGKSYKKRVNLEKHLVICELLEKSKRQTFILEEEEEQIPSQKKMFQMLIELGQKYNRLEEKVDEINKWVVKKKKKVNVLDWLNANVTPNVTFENIIDKIVVTEQDVKYLLVNSFYDVLHELFSRTIYKFDENENPIFAFIQKSNIFYIYNSEKVWLELTSDILIKFLNKVHMKVFKAFYDWKNTKKDNIKSDDSFATTCDKTLVKLMGVEFKQESTLSRIKNAMFSKMKTDMKGLVEYEFEF
jgi:uncharacterized protein YeeX (DUF496 family)